MELSEVPDTISQKSGELSEGVTPVVQSDQSRRAYIRNTLAGYLTLVVGSVTGFLLTPLLLRSFGTERFGLWVLLTATVGYIGLLELGISSVVSKRVAECAALAEPARLKTVLATASVLYLGLSGVAFSLSLLLAWVLPHLFRIETVDRSVGRLCFVWLGAYQAFRFLTLSQSATLTGLGRMDILSGISSVVLTLTALVNLTLALCGFSITALAINLFVSTVVTYLWGKHAVKKRLANLTYSLRDARPETARELLRFGGRNAVISLSGTIAYGSDTLVLGSLLSMSGVTAYAIAAKLTDLVNAFAGRPLNAMMPIYSDSQARGDHDRFFRAFTQSLHLCLLIALPFVLTLVLLGDRILFAWVGSGHESSYPICVVLALLLYLKLPGAACSVLMTGTERNLFLLRLYFFAAPINLILSILLTRAMGAIGVALASLICVSALDFFVLVHHVCHDFEFSISEYYRRVHFPLLMPMCAGVALAGVVRQLPASSNRATAALPMVLLCVTCWGLWFLLNATPAQKAKLAVFLKRKSA